MDFTPIDAAQAKALVYRGGREGVIKELRRALKARTGLTWSVTGGKGTAYGWIRIDAPPKERRFDSTGTVELTGTGPCGYMSLKRRKMLADALGLGQPTHCQGESIPSQYDYQQEYLERANGLVPSVKGVAQWD